ncbi:MAG: hypothetical protein J7J57_00325 [Caldisericaceae bacterium]|nr:hypothetical protein [Caldisericaceae bacterium]
MDKFNVIFLLGRPAAGKSEIIDFLLKLPDAERKEQFYMGKIDVIDDFPLLWAWYEEDDILVNKFHKQKLHTTNDGYFKYQYFWHLLIERISLEYKKRVRDISDYMENYTTIVEFSRGKEHGGYKEAFQHVSKELLEYSAIIYVNVSFEESLRKNKMRSDSLRPDSILHHSLADEKLTRLYKEVDWEEFSHGNSEFIQCNGMKVPYAVFENKDDVTTEGEGPLKNRIKETLEKLKTIIEKK